MYASRILLGAVPCRVCRLRVAGTIPGSLGGARLLAKSLGLAERSMLRAGKVLTTAPRLMLDELKAALRAFARRHRLGR